MAFFLLGSFFQIVIIGFFNGYFCFLVSIIFIGICTAVIGDVAAQLGCFIYLKDSVNAIAFVALGTSVPGIRKKQNKTTVKIIACRLAEE